MQMLRTIIRLDKVAALRRIFLRQGMLAGSTAAHTAHVLSEANSNPNDEDWCSDVSDDGEDWCSETNVEDKDDEMEGDDRLEDNVRERLNDAGPAAGPHGLSSIVLAARQGVY